MAQFASSPRTRMRDLSRRLGRAIASVVLLTSAPVLSGCDDGHYAWDLTAADVQGTWMTTGPLRTTLDLSADGTFAATSWPDDLRCADDSPADAEALDASGTRDISGEWSFGAGEGDDVSGGALASVNLSFDSLSCGGLSSYFRLAEDGMVSMCFPFDEDPDSYTSSRAFAFLKDAAAPSAGEACQ